MSVDIVNILYTKLCEDAFKVWIIYEWMNELFWIDLFYIHPLYIFYIANISSHREVYIGFMFSNF